MWDGEELAEAVLDLFDDAQRLPARPARPSPPCRHNAPRSLWRRAEARVHGYPVDLLLLWERIEAALCAAPERTDLEIAAALACSPRAVSKRRRALELPHSARWRVLPPYTLPPRLVALHAAIEVELRAERPRPDATIASALGCSEATVTARRRALNLPTSPVARSRLPEAKREALEELLHVSPELTDREIARRAHVGRHAVARARRRLGELRSTA